MKRITFTLPPDLEIRIKSVKRKTGYTLSDLIRQGLEMTIQKYGK